MINDNDIILHGYDIVYVWYQQLEVGEIMSMHNILPKYVQFICNIKTFVGHNTISYILQINLIILIGE